MEVSQIPIYEYKCDDCGSKFEVLVYSSDKKVACEKCGSENSRKLLSGFAAASSSSSGASCTGSGGFT